MEPQDLVEWGSVDPTSSGDTVRRMFGMGYMAGFWMYRNQIKMAFLGLDLFNFSPEGDDKPPTFQSRSKGMEVRELSPDGEEIHAEAFDKVSKIEARCDQV